MLRTTNEYNTQIADLLWPLSRYNSLSMLYSVHVCDNHTYHIICHKCLGLKKKNIIII